LLQVPSPANRNIVKAVDPTSEARQGTERGQKTYQRRLSFSKGVFVETGRLQIRETHDSEHSVRSTEDDIALLDIVKGEEEGESSREHIFLELDGVRKE
jgi:hypothetical protein